ncbi:DUF1579 domain-containing protein [Aeoliella sp. ICT_H6.2]|uniref:DUF1579 domain-containing protein n=1 Tax=Aeoliella straminimaris TaxID=2954799 RepID=A0A9X2FBH6_9BACT|nr:DUF1579 domain-containing protein [Aeoliella straminimaris]MCO6045037.1 DUF1579 domain-containing protein [Aeoliella straminimaris]
MKLVLTGLVPVVLLCVANLASSQEMSAPTPEHKWLDKFVGKWESTSAAPVGPDGGPMECTGTATYRMLGSFWVISDMKGEMPGMKFEAVQTIGYDPEAKAYIGTWVDTMMNHLWRYKGHVDKSGNKLLLEAEGPNPMDAGKIAKFRDSYEFDGKDHIIARSEIMSEDGTWVEMMRGDMRRVKEE